MPVNTLKQVVTRSSIRIMLEKGAEEPVERRDTLGFHSLKFLRSRKNRGLRLIIDLSALNCRFLTPMLQMVNAQTVEPRCQKDSDGVSCTLSSGDIFVSSS